MQPTTLVPAILLAAACSPDGAPAQTPPPPASYLTLPVDVDVRPDAPSPVRADDGRSYLLYNILVTNWSEHDLKFASIELLGTGDTVPLVRYDSTALAKPFRQRIALTSAPASPEERLLLPAGRTTIVSIGAAFDPGSAIPDSVVHGLTFQDHPSIVLINDQGLPESSLRIVSEPTSIDRRPPVVIGPPVRGGPWRCGNGLSSSNAHASAYASRNARLRVPQRYGCDFSRVDSEGNTLPNPFPDTISNEMFYGHSQDVLAVAAGVVSDVMDGIPENVPQANGEILMAVPLSERTVAGNTVTLDLGVGQFAFYAHLRPGSIRVRPGQRVGKGDVIGTVGNSGNSVGPHLHFHVGNAPSLNGSVALPYVFDAWTFAGRGSPDKSQHRPLREALPLDNAIMIFPEIPSPQGR